MKMSRPAPLKNVVVTLLIQMMMVRTMGQNISICATRPISCQISKYRSYDGSCNNFEHPQWGTTNSRFNRLLPPNYGDDISTLRVAKDGSPLPNARLVSFTVYPDLPIEDFALTLNTMQYGQILAHDMSMMKNQTRPQCCSVDHKLLERAADSKVCFPITIPFNDPVYAKRGWECFPFDRTGTDFDNGCGEENQPVEQLTQVNHLLDLSLVYGQNDEDNKAIRLFQGGKLKFDHRLGQDWLPRSLNVKATCTVVDPHEPCYLAGDPRVNKNPQLVIMQTILLREHNRIAEILANLNPQWNDEKIFQEVRKINIGQHQKIVYYDLLPHLLGKQNMFDRKLIYDSSNFVDDYDAKVNPSVINAHGAAAFRLFHSTIPGHYELVNEKRRIEGHIRLSDSFNRPRVLEDGNQTFDELTTGLCTQHQYRVDEYYDKEVTNNWARPPGKHLGLDLQALCTQRGRDHGLATYNDFREYCGLPRANKFCDFLDVISAKNVLKLSNLYKSPDDVDVTVGGALEKLVSNALAGPTFLCIMTEQFYRTRVGDRFFFENSGVTGFSLLQLNEIRKASLSRMICDNTDIKSIQPDGFLKIKLLTNSLVPCEKLPSMNLTLWKE